MAKAAKIVIPQDAEFQNQLEETTHHRACPSRKPLFPLSGNISLQQQRKLKKGEELVRNASEREWLSQNHDQNNEEKFRPQPKRSISIFFSLAYSEYMDICISRAVLSICAIIAILYLRIDFARPENIIDEAEFHNSNNDITETPNEYKTHRIEIDLPLGYLRNVSTVKGPSVFKPTVPLF
jgi:hypothetical protein